MARLFPTDPPNNFASERAVRAALSRLDDKWRIFHSVAWQSERYGRQGDGEADFVLLHPRHGMMILEVKGGQRIEVREGRWYSVSHNGETFPIKNPFEQAKDSKYALLKYLEGVAPRLAGIPICHAVAFPGATHPAGIGPYGPRDIVIDADDLLEPIKAIERVIDHWGQATQVLQEDIEEITRRLAPTVTVRKRLGTALRAVGAELFDLTEQQKAAFRITRRQRRAAVSGGPGTGKTVLALERALYLAEDGFKVLLVCFNRPLADRLNVAVQGTSVSAMTFHTLCLSECRTAGIPTNPDDPDWWGTTGANLLLEAAQITATAFDAIIVDEAQDFEGTWLQALRLLLTDPDDGIYYVFFDPRQALMAKSEELPGDLDVFPLDWNCRSTLSIARRVSGVFGDEVLAIGTEGRPTQWVNAESAEEGVPAAQALVDTLLSEEGLTPDQVVVLADNRASVERLQRMVVGDASFVELGRVGVVVETVHRFKGLEADVVVLLLGGFAADEMQARTLAYVGMSRARTMLVVIGPKSLRRTLGWDGRS